MSRPLGGPLVRGLGPASVSAAPTLPPVNLVAPVVSGTVGVGLSLSTTDGTWSGNPTLTYQWKRDGVSIGGATSSSYTMVDADMATATSGATVGPSIRCDVTGTNTAGAATAQSNALTYDLAADLGSALKVWLRGDLGVTLVSSKVSSWLSQVGGHDFTQGTDDQRPVTRTVNGLTAVDFDGSNDSLVGPNASTALGTEGDWEAAIVYVADALSASTGATAPPLIETATSNRNFMTVGSGGVYTYQFDGGGATRVATSSSAPSTGTVYRARGFYDTVNVAAKNGSGGTGTTGCTSHFSGNWGFAMRLGVQITGSTEAFDGAVCEAIMTDATMTAQQRSNVDGWLSVRWGAAI